MLLSKSINHERLETNGVAKAWQIGPMPAMHIMKGHKILLKNKERVKKANS